MAATTNKTRFFRAGKTRGNPMPIVQADRLTRIGAALLKAAGASDEEAHAVAVGCVNANLAGHDSHGVIAIPTYIDRVKAGHIAPGPKWTVGQESPTTTGIEVPSDLEAPFYLDMATSAVAAGKIMLAVARGEPIPTGWIIDAEGRNTTDPTQYRKGGALLPLGGTEGYKGSGLAAMVEVLCGLLTGLGFGVDPTGRHNDGCFMAVFNVAAFRPLADFKKEVAEFARYLKATPPSEGSSGVLYPGEIEYMREQQRKLSGIAVEDATWDRLRTLAGEYKLATELDLA